MSTGMACGCAIAMRAPASPWYSCTDGRLIWTYGSRKPPRCGRAFASFDWIGAASEHRPAFRRWLMMPRICRHCAGTCSCIASHSSACPRVRGLHCTRPVLRRRWLPAWFWMGRRGLPQPMPGVIRRTCPMRTISPAGADARHRCLSPGMAAPSSGDARDRRPCGTGVAGPHRGALSRQGSHRSPARPLASPPRPRFDPSFRPSS